MNHKLTSWVYTRAYKLSVHSAGHYSHNGLRTPPGNPDDGCRLSRPQDNERFRFIWLVQSLEFGLNGIREILRDAEAGESLCPWVCDILRQRIQQNRRKLDAMIAFQRKMVQTHA